MRKLSIKQELAINELIKGKSIVDSAKCINISEPTLNRWLSNEDFRKELDIRKNKVVDNCIDSINYMGNKAIKIINEILDSDKVSYNIKFNASKSILDMILKFNEQKNIVEKMKEIEELLNERVG